MIGRSLSLAIGQLPDPAFRRVLVKSLLISMIVFGLLAVGLWFGLLLLQVR